MLSEDFFKELSNKDNIIVLKKNDELVNQFKSLYQNYKDKPFYFLIENCGGIIIDKWVRLYGCGELDFIEKNRKHNRNNEFGILIGEDIIGGLFALKNDFIFYFAPDSMEWENLEIKYSDFLNWLVNSKDKVNMFYELYRWDGWQTDVENVGLDAGISFYPPLFTFYNINNRHRKEVFMDELIELNIGKK